MNAYTLLTILHVVAATPQHYGFFDIEVSPGYTAEQCIAMNSKAIREGRNAVCDLDENIARFVNAHGCEAQPMMVIDSRIQFRCVR